MGFCVLGLGDGAVNKIDLWSSCSVLWGEADTERDNLKPRCGAGWGGDKPGTWQRALTPPEGGGRHSQGRLLRGGGKGCNHHLWSAEDGSSPVLVLYIHYFSPFSLKPVRQMMLLLLKRKWMVSLLRSSGQ